jgi:signal transduction histidine kinase
MPPATLDPWGMGLDSSSLIAGLMAGAAAGAAALWLGLRRSEPSVRTVEPVLGELGAAMIVWPQTDTAPLLLATPVQQADLARLLGLPQPLSAQPVMAALAARLPQLGAAVDQLKQAGSRFVLELDGLQVSGGASGARPWLKLATRVTAGERLSDLDAAPVLAWRLDRAGKLVWANRAYLATVEAGSVDTAAMLGRSVEADAAVALQGQPMVGRHSFVSGGQRRTYEVIHQPLADGVAGLAFDQTGQTEQMARVAREARAHIETLDALNDAVAVFDSAQEMVFHNRAFARLWKLQDSWLAGKPTHGEWLDLMREKGRLGLTSSYRQWRTDELALYSQSLEPIDDVMWRLPDGRILRFARQRQPDGGLLLLFTDISDKTELQARYSTQLQVQAATLDRLSAAVAVFAGDGTLKLANSAFCDLWRVDPALPETHPDLSLIASTAVPLCETPAHWETLRARICDPNPQARQETQGTLDLRDGRILEWRTRPLPDGATLVAWDDVTAERRYQDQLQLAADLAVEADRLKTDFVRNIAYQLKNPLTPIKAYVEMLLMGVAGPLPDAQTGYLQTILASANDLEETINRLMQLALIEAGKMDLDIGDVNIPEALQSVAEMVQSQLADAPVRIDTACGPGVRLIRGDGARVRQMLYTLARQSLEAVSGQPDAIVRLAASARDGAVALSVWDNGPVMPVDVQHAAFSQIDSNERRSGVASVLVKRFAEMHGGWVSIRSAEGEGTTVAVHLPLEAKADHGEPELDLLTPA